MATARQQNATSSAKPVQKVDVQDIEGADLDRIGTLNSVLSDKEVTIGAPEEVVPVSYAKRNPMVVVRVNENVEDMSYVGGGKRQSYTFEAGHEYRVPVTIAQELERTGRIWH